MASTAFTYDILTGTKSTVGSIRYWANHGQLPVDQIMEEAQALIWSKIRIQEMITKQPMAVTLGDHFFTKPESFVAAITLRFDVYGEIPYIHEYRIDQHTDEAGLIYEGIPTRYAWQNGRLEFDVRAQEALAGDFTYYQSLPLLSSGNPTNVLTDKFPWILRRALMARAYEARFRDDLMDKQLLLFEAAVAEVNTASDLARMGQYLR